LLVSWYVRSCYVMSEAPTGVLVAVGLLAVPVCVICSAVLPSWVGLSVLVSAGQLTMVSWYQDR
jgi:hypothetical protein